MNSNMHIKFASVETLYIKQRKMLSIISSFCGGVVVFSTKKFTTSHNLVHIIYTKRFYKKQQEKDVLFQMQMNSTRITHAKSKVSNNVLLYFMSYYTCGLV